MINELIIVKKNVTIETSNLSKLAFIFKSHDLCHHLSQHNLGAKFSRHISPLSHSARATVLPSQVHSTSENNFFSPCLVLLIPLQLPRLVFFLRLQPQSPDLSDSRVFFFLSYSFLGSVSRLSFVLLQLLPSLTHSKESRRGYSPDQHCLDLFWVVAK